MSADQRERCLRGWATSRVPQRRKAFQALKRLTTVTHYTTPGAAHAIGFPARWVLHPRHRSRSAPSPLRPTPRSAATSVVVARAPAVAWSAAELPRRRTSVLATGGSASVSRVEDPAGRDIRWRALLRCRVMRDRRQPLQRLKCLATLRHALVAQPRRQRSR